MVFRTPAACTQGRHVARRSSLPREQMVSIRKAVSSCSKSLLWPMYVSLVVLALASSSQSSRSSVSSSVVCLPAAWGEEVMYKILRKYWGIMRRNIDEILRNKEDSSSSEWNGDPKGQILLLKESVIYQGKFVNSCYIIDSHLLWPLPVIHVSVIQLWTM